jgi:hypothetical protein
MSKKCDVALRLALLLQTCFSAEDLCARSFACAAQVVLFKSTFLPRYITNVRVKRKGRRLWMLCRGKLFCCFMPCGESKSGKVENEECIVTTLAYIELWQLWRRCPTKEQRWAIAKSCGGGVCAFSWKNAAKRFFPQILWPRCYYLHKRSSV